MCGPPPTVNGLFVSDINTSVVGCNAVITLRPETGSEQETTT